jgi:hypothetical protein
MKLPVLTVLAALAALAVPAPAQAELAGQTCDMFLAQVKSAVASLGGYTLTGATEVPQGETCLYRDILLDAEGQYSPDFRADLVSVSGGMMPWLTGAAVEPERLEVRATGLRNTVQTGDAVTDYFLEAQSMPFPSSATLTVFWDMEAKVMRVEPFTLDLPGNNAVTFSMAIAGASDPLSLFVMADPMALAVTEARLEVTSHGFFEAYALPGLAAAFLSGAADPKAEAEALRTEALNLIAALPDAVVSAVSRDELAQLITELPNPAGRLVLDLRADPGIGAARFAVLDEIDIPETIADAAPLYQGVTLDVDWTHQDWKN